MKTKITDHQSLLLEKQRLTLLCASQEKEMAENFSQLKEKLNPSLMIKEAILEIIPNEIREHKVLQFISTLFSGKRSETAQSIGGELFGFAKSALLTAAISYLDKYLKKD